MNKVVTCVLLVAIAACVTGEVEPSRSPEDMANREAVCDGARVPYWYLGPSTPERFVATLSCDVHEDYDCMSLTVDISFADGSSYSGTGARSLTATRSSIRVEDLAPPIFTDPHGREHVLTFGFGANLDASLESEIGPESFSSIIDVFHGAEHLLDYEAFVPSGGTIASVVANDGSSTVTLDVAFELNPMQGYTDTKYYECDDGQLALLDYFLCCVD